MAELKCLKMIQRIGRVRAIRKLITSIPPCPGCGGPLEKDAETGRYVCDDCDNEWEAWEVMDSYFYQVLLARQLFNLPRTLTI